MTEEPNASSVSLVVIGLIGGSLITLGFVSAVMRRAGDDYRKTRDSVKGLRKAYYKSIWTTVKAGGIAVITLVLLIMWVVRDIRKQ